jgi:site-specific recombinase XerD
MDIQILAQKFYEYSTFMKGYSKETIRRYRYVINFYCKHTDIGEISQVTDANVRALFLYGRTQRNWKVSTYIVFYKSLKVFFRWCIKENHLIKNPVEGMEVPRLEKSLPPKLTKQDSIRLLEVVNNFPYEYKYLRSRNHAIFSMFLFAGLRKQELLNLRLNDVDINNLTIFVKEGKGKKDRIIPMSYSLAQSLKSYLIDRKRLKKTCPEFFVSLNRNQGFTDGGLKKLIDIICIASGIKFTAHKLRHSFAVLMLEGGCDIYSLSRMMGHSDIKTTTIYLAASAEHLRAQITKHPLNNI